MGKWRYLHQHFVTVANYINCNIFIKIWNDSSVITTPLTTKLYQGLIFNGSWHTKLKFIFNKVVNQHPIEGAAAEIVQISKMIVLIAYAQICPKWFLTVMTPRYIAFIVTKNWFGQTWARMGNWYYMGCWVNVWNFRKKIFFSKFQHFLFWEWFKCYFWIWHPQINKSTKFHKNSVNQTQNMNENAQPSISKITTKRTKEKDCGPNF